jgi:outer membrane protein assembly factor BamA
MKQLVISILCIVIALGTMAQKYPVHYHLADEDSLAMQKVDLKSSFANRMEANTYLAKLKKDLQVKGFVTASIDSVQLDSAGGKVHLYVGEQYKWARINTDPADEDVLTAIRFPSNSLSGATINFASLQTYQEQVLNYLEERGYPFAKVYLDSLTIQQSEVTANLKINRGGEYKIDSIRLYGDARVSNEFLQRYLDITNGSLYNKRKLNNVDKRLSELSYVQLERPSNLTMLGTGSILNLYLQPKKTSQVNALVGFLPNSDQNADKKMQIVVDANILLRNALGSGETLGFTWQQLQQSSPRINLVYEQPYIFHSPLALNFNFEMFRKDSSFLNINMQLGAGYTVSGNQSAIVFIQRRQTIVNGVNTALVVQNKRLPQEADVSSINFGVSYNFNTTNYRFNPQKGNDFVITASTGTKTIKKNTQVLELKDPSDPSFKFESLYDTVKLNTYQFRITTVAAHYFPLGKQSAFKTGLNAGIFQSGNIFRNELFLLGGYRSLRGFDEESQYVSQYAIGTLEYRYLIGLNSNFFVFLDGGWGKYPLEAKQTHTYFGTGLGLSFETKAGIFNLAWAVGRRDDIPFNLRQSKIHLGFASYF